MRRIVGCNWLIADVVSGALKSVPEALSVENSLAIRRRAVGAPAADRRRLKFKTRRNGSPFACVASLRPFRCPASVFDAVLPAVSRAERIGDLAPRGSSTSDDCAIERDRREPRVPEAGGETAMSRCENNVSDARPFAFL